jgi:hypothetical protein
MNKIAVVFDFDDTLALDSTSGFLESLGADVNDFWKNKVQPMLNVGWDPIPAYLYQMIELSQSGIVGRITEERFRGFADNIIFHGGVDTIFARLKEYTIASFPDIYIEFYLISSGIGDIVRHTKISKNFTEMWACDFVYNQEGGIHFPKKIVSFTDKTRYLFYISKGLIGKKYESLPFEVNKKVDTAKLRIPMDQIIFVGDGYTDVPCFSLVMKSGGIAFGVYDIEERSKWDKAWGFIEDRRVSNLLSANFSAKSDLSNSLIMAIESIARKIQLKMLAYQG